MLLAKCQKQIGSFLFHLVSMRFEGLNKRHQRAAKFSQNCALRFLKNVIW